MSNWFIKEWNKFSSSYDAPTAAVQSSPGVIFVSVASLIVGFLTIGYVPPIASLSEFKTPWLPMLFATAGAFCSYQAWKHKAVGPVGSACMFLDTLLYTTAISLAAILTSDPFSIGFALALALFLIAFPSRVYALTLVFAFAVCAPPLLLVAFLERDPLVVLIMWVGCTLALGLAHRTGQQHTLRIQNERLRSALGAADRLAEQSMEAALAASLLDIGHFLHELRNLRAVQRTNLQFVRELASLDGGTLDALDEIIQAQEREDKLISNAVNTLRVRANPTRESFDLHQVIKEFLKTRMDKLPLVLSFQSPPVAIQGDRQHIIAIFANLIRNAATAGATQATVEIKANADAKSVSIVVEDDGPGLKEEQLPDLFRPFSVVENSGGIGLGLYLVRRYVNLLGGTIEASNGEKGGARFQILIPANPSKAEYETN